METHVYINNREASSKASDGVSKAAFPDPCWTPPPPPAGPIVVPYPNTAYASTMKDGTTTVFVCNSMVAKEDISYFSTSTGDEGATQTQPKGAITGVIKGKAYFKSWSPNVKFEGKCVARHEDLMSHNHGSEPGNTSTYIYQDTLITRKACQHELDRVDKLCKPETENEDDGEKEKTKTHLKKQNLMKLMGDKIVIKLEEVDKKVKDRFSKFENSNNKWIFSHCKGLWIKPISGKTPGLDDFNKLVKELSDDLTKNIEKLLKPFLDELIADVEQRAKKVAIHQAEKLAVRAGAKWGIAAAGVAAGGVGGVVTEAVATIWNICDAAVTIYDSVQAGTEAYRKIKEIKELGKLAKRAADELESAIKATTPTDIMATGMAGLAKLNPCVRAKRCLLSQYSKTGTKGSIRTGEGCCPGQTGHHLLPDEMTKGNCEGYEKGTAPTVCVEGANNGNGTHGAMHDAMIAQIKKYRRKGWFGEKKTLDYDTAKKIALDSFYRVFPESFCDRKCLEAQMDAYYKKCSSDMPAVAGKAFTEDSDSYDTTPNVG